MTALWLLMYSLTLCACLHDVEEMDPEETTFIHIFHGNWITL